MRPYKTVIGIHSNPFEDALMHANRLITTLTDRPEQANRRRVVVGAAALVAAPFGHVLAQTPGTALPPVKTTAFDGIHYLRGLVRVNGERITSERAVIKPGDTLTTGSDGQLWFAVGTDAFFLRQRTELVIQPNPSQITLVGALRLVTGAVGSAFGKRSAGGLRITTATATIGIRGTGTYLETRGDGLYCCTCHGEVELTSNRTGASAIVKGTQHSPRLCIDEPIDGSWIKEAPFETHTDEEMDALEKCVGRRAPWVKKSFF